MRKDWGEEQDSRDTGNVTGLLESMEYCFAFLVEGDLDREWRIRSTAQIRSSAGCCLAAGSGFSMNKWSGSIACRGQGRTVWSSLLK